MSERRSRRRSSRERGTRTSSVAAPAYVKREIPFYAFLNEENIVRIEEQADWIIQEVGLEFREDPIALEIWKEAGASGDRAQSCRSLWIALRHDFERADRAGKARLDGDG